MREYDACVSDFVLIQQGFFMAWNSANLYMFDENFERPMASVQLVEKVQSATYLRDSETVVLVFEGSVGIVSLNAKKFSVQQQSLTFQLTHKERVLACFGNVYITTCRVYANSAGTPSLNKVFDTQLTFGADAEYRMFKGFIVANGSKGVFLISESSGDITKIIDIPLRKLYVREQQNLIYAITADTQLIKISLTDLKLVMAGNTFKETVKDVYLNGRLIFWIDESGDYGFERWK